MFSKVLPAIHESQLRFNSNDLCRPVLVNGGVHLVTQDQADPAGLTVCCGENPAAERKLMLLCVFLGNEVKNEKTPSDVQNVAADQTHRAAS